MARLFFCLVRLGFGDMRYINQDLSKAQISRFWHIPFYGDAVDLDNRATKPRYLRPEHGNKKVIILEVKWSKMLTMSRRIDWKCLTTGTLLYQTAPLDTL
jgi:hypothetical protein